jgi:predicted nucleic acid-binding protein
MILLDTDIMIDILRQHPPALSWSQELGDDPVGLPGFVGMELLQGCRNREEQDRLTAQLRPFVLYWPTEADCLRAYQDFAAFHLSHGLGILDALIAETAVGLGTRLATFNAKHYSMLGALDIVQPYTRGSQ